MRLFYHLAAIVQILRPLRRRLAPVIEISSAKRRGPDQEIPKKKAA